MNLHALLNNVNIIRILLQCCVTLTNWEGCWYSINCMQLLRFFLFSWNSEQHIRFITGQDFQNSEHFKVGWLALTRTNIVCLRWWLLASFGSLIEFPASCVLFKRGYRVQHVFQGNSHYKCWSAMAYGTAGAAFLGWQIWGFSSFKTHRQCLFYSGSTAY